MEEKEVEIKDDYPIGIYRHPNGLVFRIMNRHHGNYDICILYNANGLRHPDSKYKRWLIVESKEMTTEEIAKFYYFMPFKEYKAKFPKVTRRHYDIMRDIYMDGRTDCKLNVMAIKVHD